MNLFSINFFVKRSRSVIYVIENYKSIKREELEARREAAVAMNKFNIDCQPA